jgi:hypothetical protein
MTNQASQITFPGQAVSPNPPLTLVLPAGGSLLVPQGNFFLKVPPQSALQYLDSDSGLWRILEAGLSGSPIQISSDGSNYKVINLSSTITGANVTAAGTLYNQANAAVAFAAPSTGNTATGYPIVGGSLSFSLTATGANGVVGSGGSGYTNPIIIMPEPQQFGAANDFGISASLSATLTAGVISALTTIFAGAGYLNLPSTLTTKTITPTQFATNPDYWLNQTNIIIIDPTGTGANIVPAITNGTAANGGITGIVMTSNGSGYTGTTIPAVTISGTTGSGSTATALPSLALTGVTIGGTNTGYTASAELLSSLGNGTAIARVNDESILPRAAKVVVPQTAGVLSAAVIEDAGSGFQTVPLLKQVGNATADGSVNATFVAVVGGVTNTLILWQVG